jgi:ADP-ribose pyrophosphatase YjhB (NUDIX family)
MTTAHKYLQFISKDRQGETFMKHLATSVDPEVQAQKDFQTQVRLASRAIVLNKQNEILALYTDRFDDYSLPGGGLRDGEDPIVGMVRELQEETGAYNVHNIQPFLLLCL